MSDKRPQTTSSTREINYKHKSYSLLRVPVVFHNISKFALIDTGAAASFISNEFLATIPDESINHEIVNTKDRVFRSASGETMRISSMYNLKVKLLPDCTVNQVFYVLPKLEEECILGIDFLHNNAISLDVFNKEMRIGTHQDGKTIKLNRITKKSFPLYRIVDQPHLDFEINHLKGKPLYLKFLNLLISFTSMFVSTLLDLGKTTAIKHHTKWVCWTSNSL